MLFIVLHIFQQRVKREEKAAPKRGSSDKERRIF
jgi:hypothetical protein